jgi:hypothetical protein
MKFSWRTALIAGIAVLTLAACTPEQISVFRAVTEPTRDALSDSQLAALRRCESHDNYEAVSAGGWYRGAYQFSRSTWDSTAEGHFFWLIGRDPADVEPWWQDAMARALWSDRGRSPWPVCGPAAARS